MKLFKNKIIISIFIMIALSIIFLAVLYFLPIKSENKNSQHIIEIPKELITLFIPTKDATFITKQLEIKREENELRKIESVLLNFINELPEPLNETKINEIYRDKENVIYLDFSPNFSTPKDAREEYYLLKGVYTTLKSNFTWLTDIKILIAGEERETLAGHVLIESLKESLEENK